MVLNRRGFTGVVDAMFFIMLIGIAVALLSSAVPDAPQEPEADASAFCDAAFRSKVTGEEFGMDTGDGRTYPVVDLTAASLSVGDGAAASYFGKLLDGVFERPGSYLMTLDFGGNAASVGSGGGREASGFSGDYASRYGTLHVELHLY